MCLFDIKIVNYKKVEKINLLGALVTISFYIIAISIFSLRILGRPQYGHYLGYFLLMLIIPMFYLLVEAPYFNRPFIYYIQMSDDITNNRINFRLSFENKFQANKRDGNELCHSIFYSFRRYVGNSILSR